MAMERNLETLHFIGIESTLVGTPSQTINNTFSKYNYNRAFMFFWYEVLAEQEEGGLGPGLSPIHEGAQDSGPQRTQGLVLELQAEVGGPLSNRPQVQLLC